MQNGMIERKQTSVFGCAISLFLCCVRLSARKIWTPHAEPSSGKKQKNSPTILQIAFEPVSRGALRSSEEALKNEPRRSSAQPIISPNLREKLRKPLLESRLLAVYGVWQREGDIARQIANFEVTGAEMAGEDVIVTGKIEGKGFSMKVNENEPIRWVKSPQG